MKTANWTVLWKNRKWKHKDGAIIERRWNMVTREKENFYFCYKDEKSYFSGNTFCTKETLTDAKLACVHQ